MSNHSYSPFVHPIFGVSTRPSEPSCFPRYELPLKYHHTVSGSGNGSKHLQCHLLRGRRCGTPKREVVPKGFETGGKRMIVLRPITKDNWQAAAELTVRDDQVGFVMPNAWAIAESKFYDALKPTAIYDGGTMVGFLAYGRNPHDDSVLALSVHDRHTPSTQRLRTRRSPPAIRPAARHHRLRRTQRRFRPEQLGRRTSLSQCRL